MSLRTLFTIFTVLSTAYLVASNSLAAVDPKCPQGTLPGFTINTFRYTNVTQNVFYSKIGSFIHSEWYTGPLTSTEGQDNAVGTTRSSVLGGTALTEKMIAFSWEPDKFTQRFSLANGPLKFGGAIVPNYTEELSAMSICSGTATYVTITDVFCSDKPQAIADLLASLTSGAIGGVAKQVGGIAFNGTCPT